ncbi:MAG: response regulator [Calditrichaeota bacterium]|nr:MAG: response regulator [Calditrichota bacterium]
MKTAGIMTYLCPKAREKGDKMKHIARPEKQFHILIVDDEPDVLVTIAMNIRAEGYHIHKETDPERALEWLATHPCDVLITDIMMPGVSGMDIIKTLRDQPEKDTEIIVITGFATLQTAMEAVQQGVYDYIQKPIDQLALKQVVAHATEKLYLKRQNTWLLKNNTRLLNHLSTLNEISKILYQLNDVGAAAEMALDTMLEYFQLKKVALFQWDHRTQQYRFLRQKGFSSQWNNFAFKADSILNHVKITGGQIHIVPMPRGRLTFEQGHLETEKGSLVFIPVVFQDATQAWLAYLTDDKAPVDVEHVNRLLSILANHIAPVISLRQESGYTGLTASSLTAHIQQHLNRAADTMTPVGFSLFRFEPLAENDNPLVIQDTLESARLKIQSFVDEETDVIWQTVDTVLFVLPNRDYFNCETFSDKLTATLEKYFRKVETPVQLDITHSCVGYPECGDEASSLLWRLWTQLIQEQQREKEKSRLIQTAD